LTALIIPSDDFTETRRDYAAPLAGWPTEEKILCKLHDPWCASPRLRFGLVIRPWAMSNVLLMGSCRDPRQKLSVTHEPMSVGFLNSCEATLTAANLSKSKPDRDYKRLQALRLARN
jgi:hypothetical protein